jgi:hypothetical protein
MSTIRANTEPRWSVICACIGLLAILPTLLYILSLLPFHVAAFVRQPAFSGDRAAFFAGALPVIGAFCYFATFYFVRLARRHFPLLRTTWTLSALAHLTLAILCGAGAYHTISRMGGTDMPFNFALALLCTAFASVAFLGSTYAAFSVFNQRA